MIYKYNHTITCCTKFFSVSLITSLFYGGGSSRWVLGWAWGGAKECEGYKVGKGVGVCVHFRTKEQGGVWVEVIGGVRECEEQGGVWGCSADW